MGSFKSIWHAEKALAKLRDLPRVGLRNVKPRPEPEYEAWYISKKPRVYGFGGRRGWHDRTLRRMNFDPIGYERLKTPMAYRTPVEKSYNYGWMAKKQYPPLSLKNLQLLIDTGRIDPTKPIDLAAIAISNVFPIRPDFHHFGVNLTDEGMDRFDAKVNIEVQWASEATIAAVERNGGVITTTYFDFNCVRALVNPKNWFLSGQPIPRRLHPTQDVIGFYTNPETRGYLADPKLISEHRLILAQKYGYELPKIDPEDPLLSQVKDPRQVFYGLAPGWVVNLKDKVVYKPQDEELNKFYKEEFK